MVRGQLVPIPPVPLGCHPGPYKVDQPKFVLGNLDDCNYTVTDSSIGPQPRMMCAIFRNNSQVNDSVVFLIKKNNNPGVVYDTGMVIFKPQVLP